MIEGRIIRKRHKGFTLIELSVVLVIIGLIVGGVLVGRDLISASEVRAQVSQIEKIQTAVNTFRGKFGGMPGDLTRQYAESFGFDVSGCGGGVGMRNGNDILEVILSGHTLEQGGGENGLFWKDLASSAGGNLVEGSFSNIGCSTQPTASSTGFGQYFPGAKLGSGNYVAVYSDGSVKNYLTVGMLTSLNSGVSNFSPSLPVNQVYSIDKKVDDGSPITGVLMPYYLRAVLPGLAGMGISTSAPTSSSSTCYQTTTSAYSIDYNGGTAPNCSIAFQLK